MSDSEDDESNFQDISFNERDLFWRTRHFHLAPEYKKQLKSHELHLVTIIKSLLKRIREGYDKYLSYGKFLEEAILIKKDLLNDSYYLEEEDIVKFMSKYETLLRQTIKFADPIFNYRIGWGFLEEIVQTLYPLSHCVYLFLRTNELWQMLAQFICLTLKNKLSYKKSPFTIPWRPICDFFSLINEEERRFIDKNLLNINSRESIYFDLLRCSSFYFDESAFNEIWEYLSQGIQPDKVLYSMSLFVSLLPPDQCCNDENQKALALKVLELLFNLCEDRFQGYSLFSKIVSHYLLIITSGNNIGKINFSPYAEMLFTFHLRGLNINSGFLTSVPSLRSRNNSSNNHEKPFCLTKTNACTISIIYSLPADIKSPLWGHLRRLLRFGDTFISSVSHSTRYSKSFVKTLETMIKAFLARYKSQLLKKTITPIPESHVITSETANYFAELFLEPLMRIILSKSNHGVDLWSQLYILVSIAPNIVFPRIKELIIDGKECGSQTDFPIIVARLLGIIAQFGSATEDISYKNSAIEILQNSSDWMIIMMEEVGPVAKIIVENNFFYIFRFAPFSKVFTAAPSTNIMDQDSSLIAKKGEEIAVRITKSLLMLDNVKNIKVSLCLFIRSLSYMERIAVLNYICTAISAVNVQNYNEPSFLVSCAMFLPKETIEEYYCKIAEPLIRDINTTSTLLVRHVCFTISLIECIPPDVLLPFFSRIRETILGVTFSHITSPMRCSFAGMFTSALTSTLWLQMVRYDVTENEIDSLTQTYKLYKGKDVKVNWYPISWAARTAFVSHIEDIIIRATEMCYNMDATVLNYRSLHPSFDGNTDEEPINVASIRRGILRIIGGVNTKGGHHIFDGVYEQITHGNIDTKVLVSLNKLDHSIEDILQARTPKCIFPETSFITNSPLASDYDNTQFELSKNLIKKTREMLKRFTKRKINQFLLDKTLECEEMEDVEGLKAGLLAIHFPNSYDNKKLSYIASAIDKINNRWSYIDFADCAQSNLPQSSPNFVSITGNEIEKSLDSAEYSAKIIELLKPYYSLAISPFEEVSFLSQIIIKADLKNNDLGLTYLLTESFISFIKENFPYNIEKNVICEKQFACALSLLSYLSKVHAPNFKESSLTVLNFLINLRMITSPSLMDKIDANIINTINLLTKTFCPTRKEIQWILYQLEHPTKISRTLGFINALCNSILPYTPQSIATPQIVLLLLCFQSHHDKEICKAAMGATAFAIRSMFRVCKTGPLDFDSAQIKYFYHNYFVFRGLLFPPKQGYVFYRELIIPFDVEATKNAHVPYINALRKIIDRNKIDEKIIETSHIIELVSYLAYISKVKFLPFLLEEAISLSNVWLKEAIKSDKTSVSGAEIPLAIAQGCRNGAWQLIKDNGIDNDFSTGMARDYYKKSGETIINMVNSICTANDLSNENANSFLYNNAFCHAFDYDFSLKMISSLFSLCYNPMSSTQTIHRALECINQIIKGTFPNRRLFFSAIEYLKLSTLFCLGPQSNSRISSSFASIIISLSFITLNDSTIWNDFEGLAEKMINFLKDMTQSSIEAMKTTATKEAADNSRRAASNEWYCLLSVFASIPVFIINHLTDIILDWLIEAQIWVQNNEYNIKKVISLSRTFSSLYRSKTCAKNLVMTLCDKLERVVELRDNAILVATKLIASNSTLCGSDKEKESSDNEDFLNLESPTSTETSPNEMNRKANYSLQMESFDPKLALENQIFHSSSTNLVPTDTNQSEKIKNKSRKASIMPCNLRTFNKGLSSKCAKIKDINDISNNNSPHLMASSCYRRTVLMLIEILQGILSFNFHRIGKFLVFQRCFDVLISVLGHDMKTLAINEGSAAQMAIAVLVRTSSDEQINSVITPLIKLLQQNVSEFYNSKNKIPRNASQPLTPVDCHKNASKTPTVTKCFTTNTSYSTSINVKRAVKVLCAVLIAYPDSIPPFCGRAILALGPYFRSPKNEIKNPISRMFKFWWKAHKDLWETKYKFQFTQKELDNIEDLLHCTSYYA